MRKILIVLVSLFLAGISFASDMPPFIVEDGPSQLNFEDLYLEKAYHRHSGGDGSSRLRDVLPGVDSVYDLGASGRAWSEIYGDTVFGVNQVIAGTDTASIDANDRSFYVLGDFEVADDENNGFIYTNTTQSCGSGYKSFELTNSSQSFEFNSCGELGWGPGNTAFDVNLRRKDVGILSSSGTFHFGVDSAVIISSAGYAQFGALSSTPSAISGFALLYASNTANTELFVKDSAGNETLLSPHNARGDWIFHSFNEKTGKRQYYNMTWLFRFLVFGVLVSILANIVFGFVIFKRGR